MKESNSSAEREKLMKELIEIYHDTNYPTRMHLIEAMAEFVIQDRKRIVEPLVDIKELEKIQFVYLSERNFAIDKTLKNAGFND